MKTVRIDDLEYGLYEQIRDILLDKLYFAVECQYSAKLKIGVFTFQDSSYIPNELEEYAANIKGNSALIDKANDELKILFIDN